MKQYLALAKIIGLTLVSAILFLGFVVKGPLISIGDFVK